MYSLGFTLTFLFLEISLLSVVGYLVYLRAKAFINEEELHTPKFIETVNLSFEWNNMPIAFIIMMILAMLVSILASFAWPVVWVVGAVIATVLYLRDKKRKEKVDENT